MTDTTGIVSWQDGDTWLGCLEAYPDYWAEGETLDELVENLRALAEELSSGTMPPIERAMWRGRPRGRRRLAGCGSRMRGWTPRAGRAAEPLGEGCSNRPLQADCAAGRVWFESSTYWSTTAYLRGGATAGVAVRLDGDRSQCIAGSCFGGAKVRERR